MRRASLTLLAAAGAALALAGNAWADAIVGLGESTLTVETSAVTEAVDAAVDAVAPPAVDTTVPDVLGVAIVVDAPVGDRVAPSVATPSSEPEATPPPAVSAERSVSTPARGHEYPITLELAPATPIGDTVTPAAAAPPRASPAEPVVGPMSRTSPPVEPSAARNARERVVAPMRTTVIATAAPVQPALPPAPAFTPPPLDADGAQPLPFVPGDAGSSLFGSVASSAFSAPVVAALFLLALAVFLPRLGRVLASTASKLRAPELSLLLERPG